MTQFDISIETLEKFESSQLGASRMVSPNNVQIRGLAKHCLLEEEAARLHKARTAVLVFAEMVRQQRSPSLVFVEGIASRFGALDAAALSWVVEMLVAH